MKATEHYLPWCCALQGAPEDVSVDEIPKRFLYQSGTASFFAFSQTIFSFTL